MPRAAAKVRGFRCSHTTQVRKRIEMRETQGGKKSKRSRWKQIEEWWVIDARTNSYIAHWDLLMSCALFYVALVTPVEVCASMHL